MILTKKHIGRLFDTQGGDGSWAYQLIDIKGKELLFYSVNDGKFEIDSNKYRDWRPFKRYENNWPMRHVKLGWKSGRRAT